MDSFWRFGKRTSQTPLYEAETTLIYERPLDVSNPFSGSYSEFAGSRDRAEFGVQHHRQPDVTDMARERLEADQIAVGYSVTAGPPESAGCGHDMRDRRFWSQQ